MTERPTARAGEAGALWGGRFAGGPSAELAALSKSTHFDWQLAEYDLAGSRAHARALAAAGYLDDSELQGMLDALERLRASVVEGRFTAADSDEDVHGALERGLMLFSRARALNLEALRALSPSDWRRSGAQEGVGHVTLADIPRMMVAHDRSHETELAGLLEEIRGGRPAESAKTSAVA